MALENASGYSVDGFVDYDGNGEPFMGLQITDAHTQVKVYLSHRDGARKVARMLSEQLGKMSSDLVGMPNKIVAAEGSLNGIRNT